MRRIFTTILLVAIIAGCFWGAGRLGRDLLDLRREYRLTGADPLANMPPMVAFTTVALGGFRGLLVDYLWGRAARLQEEGKYFEIVQLADWITELEPRLGEVWAFHAWNMAYNISVLFQDPEDRWRWVRHGIALLRDRGLVYNPDDANLYRELGWLFQHKVGDVYDQAHWHYKREWAAEMAGLFDGPQPDYPALRAAPDSPRARRMIGEYKLLPDVMEKVDTEYGPLDWRLPDAHAIYWAYRGRPYARSAEAVNIDRMIFQSLANAFRRGRLVASTDQAVFIPSPNLDLLPRVRAAYEDAMAAHPDQETIKAAYGLFLREAILILCTYNRTAEARDLFEALRQRYPSDETKQEFDDFLYGLATSQLDDLSIQNVSAIVQGALFQSFFWLALGEQDRAQGFAQLAQTTWNRYMAGRAGGEVRERTGLPPIEELRRLALEEVRGLLTNSVAAARLEAEK